MRPALLTVHAVKAWPPLNWILTKHFSHNHLSQFNFCTLHALEAFFYQEDKRTHVSLTLFCPLKENI